MAGNLPCAVASIRCALMVSRAAHFGDTQHPAVRARLFLGLLWVALSTVLASALLPMGLPLTKTIGSAFSPSTATVALSAKPLRWRIPGKKLVTPGDSDTAHQTVVPLDNPNALPPTELLLPSRDESVPLFSPLPVGQLPSRILPESAYPRGPPTAG
jgi:hypothetical protein